MMFRAAIALLALAVPAFAQHGGAHAGSFAGRGFAGQGFSRSNGSSSRPGFSSPVYSRSPGFSRSAPAYRYGSFAGYRAYGQPGLRSPYYANRFAAGRPAYNSRTAVLNRGSDRDRSSNQDRFNARRRQYQNWVVNTYPYGSGYPYLIDPNAYNLGLYDWDDDSDDSASGSSQPGDSASGSSEPDSYLPDSYPPGSYQSDQDGPDPAYLGPYPEQRPPYPGEGYAASNQQPPEAPAISGMPLTVIFKDGRAAIQVRNYLMTAKVLTDLDSEHYEQIPLDQIDLAATRRFNTFAGVDFQVPSASRD